MQGPGCFSPVVETRWTLSFNSYAKKGEMWVCLGEFSSGEDEDDDEEEKKKNAVESSPQIGCEDGGAGAVCCKCNYYTVPVAKMERRTLNGSRFYFGSAVGATETGRHGTLGTQRKYTDPEPLGMETGEERQESKPARE